MLYLLIFGFPTRYVAGAVALLLLALLVVAVLLRRRRRPGLVLRDLPAEETERYLASFASVEREFVDHPAQAAARARGLVEEVMRRRGFPDRIEPSERITDLRRHDREAARALEAANGSLSTGANDTEKLRLGVQGYRTVLGRLAGPPRQGPP